MQIEEVAKIYSQNSTALAREFIKTNAFNQIMNAFYDITKVEEKEEKVEKEPVKKKKD